MNEPKDLFDLEEPIFELDVLAKLAAETWDAIGHSIWPSGRSGPFRADDIKAEIDRMYFVMGEIANRSGALRKDFQDACMAERAKFSG